MKTTRETAILAAKLLWMKRCGEYRAKHGDAGTCVLGAAIVPPEQAFKVCPDTLISVSEVTGCQGSLVWESSVGEVVTLLNDLGVPATYNAGRMD